MGAIPSSRWSAKAPRPAGKTSMVRLLRIETGMKFVEGPSAKRPYGDPPRKSRAPQLSAIPPALRGGAGATSFEGIAPILASPRPALPFLSLCEIAQSANLVSGAIACLGSGTFRSFVDLFENRLLATRGVPLVGRGVPAEPGQSNGAYGGWPYHSYHYRQFVRADPASISQLSGLLGDSPS